MGWVVNATPRPLHPRERPGTHCIGGWVFPRAGMEGCGKSRPPPGFDPRTVQPVASRYTDGAIPAQSIAINCNLIFGPTLLFNNVRTPMRNLPFLFVADISQKVRGIAFCEIITEISLH
jgi:hypothetical protein